MLSFLLSTNKLHQIGKILVEAEDWISHLKEYPNLKGYFDKRWGDTPDEQIKNFINYFI